MKSRILNRFLAMMVTLAASSSAFGNHLEKIYIDLDRVIFNSSGIWIENDGCYQGIDAIIFDKEENR